jgi:protein MPE1
MMNEEGKFVVQVADDKTWQTFKKKMSKNDEVLNDLKNSVDPRFLDPIDKKIMTEPMTTPCCGTTYSKTTIEDLLLESDFVCPNCSKEDIFLDQLKPNEELSKQINECLDSEFEKRGIKRNLNDDNSANKRQNLGSLPIRPDGSALPPIIPGLPLPAFGIIPPQQPLQSQEQQSISQ